MSKFKLKKAKSHSGPPRELSVIRNEYANFCALAGEAQFKIPSIEADLRSYNRRLSELVVEMQAAERLAAHNAKVAAEPPAEAPIEPIEPPEMPTAPESAPVAPIESVPDSQN